jgi:predicted tellurium resistance membrane protein TerC
MKKHKKKSIKIFVLAILSFGFSMKLFAQNQPDIPKPRGPVDLSDPANVVIFIVIPILIFIFYLIWRREMKKRKEREE